MAAGISPLLDRIGWKGAELARRTGRPRSTVQRWIDGTAAPPAPILKALEEIAVTIDCVGLGDQPKKGQT